MKDLFCGSLGRTNNHGGSSLFSTPSTINIAPEYYISININRNFVTCSLDGRLWAYGSGTAYVLFAFKWNEETSRLEQSAYLNFRGEKIKARGLDWLITDKSLIYVSDDEPYIHVESLFDNGSGRFLFSILRSGITEYSGTDIFTNQAWGKDKDGNSEGWGFFTKNNIKAMELCYSSLPSAGEWYITPNFLLRKFYENSYNSMRILRPLIPLEFSLYNDGTAKPDYGTGCNTRDIQLVRRGNAVFGRGLNHIGRVFLLPAVFGEDGQVLEFYLYISPDYVFNNSGIKDNDEWLNMAVIASPNSSLYGFLVDEADSLSSSLCLKADDTRGFLVQSGEWKNFGGDIFIDTANSSAISVNDEGLSLFGGRAADFQGKGLKQWINPSGNISLLSDNIICSQSDNCMLAVNISRQFTRNSLGTKRLPLSATSYRTSNGGNVRLSMGETNGNRKNIAVNHFASTEIKHSIDWNDIFRQTVSIRLANTFEQPFSSILFLNGMPVFSNGISCKISRAVDQYNDYRLEIPAEQIQVKFAYDGIDSGGFMKFPDLVHSASLNLSAFNPASGSLEAYSFSVSYSNKTTHFSYYKDEADIPPNDYIYWPEGTELHRPKSVAIRDGKIGIISGCIYSTSDKGDRFDGEDYFTPLASIDSIVHDNWISGSNGLCITHLYLPNGKLDSLPENCSSAAYAVFREKYTLSNFALHLPSLLHIDENGRKSGFFSEAKSFTFYECCKDTSTLHFVVNDTKNKIAVLLSETFNDTFNFLDELERSTLP